MDRHIPMCENSLIDLLHVNAMNVPLKMKQNPVRHLQGWNILPRVHSKRKMNVLDIWVESFEPFFAHGAVELVLLLLLPA